jgi:hypothetical protein
MAREGKKYASITWADLHEFCTVLRATSDLIIVTKLENVGGQRGLFRCTVELHEGRTWALDGACIKTASGPMNVREGEQAGLVMYLVNHAYSQYTADPWNWTLKDRMKEATLNSHG